MRKLILIGMLLMPTHALAGFCNTIGQVTQCFSDNGDLTTLNRVGNTYLGQTEHKNGRATYENYQLYDYNQPSGESND